MKIYAQKISKNFGSSKILLKELDFEFSSNVIYGISGLSGEGKSTLLHILGGIEKPSYGQIIFLDDQGQSVSDLEISFVFQENNLLSDLTALENLILPQLIKKTPLKIAIKQGQALMAKFNIQNISDQHPAELSGGEKQRIAIIRSILQGAHFLLADEPSTGLDKKNTEILIETMLQLKEQLNVGIIFCSHDEKLLEIADVRLDLSDGVLTQLPLQKRLICDQN